MRATLFVVVWMPGNFLQFRFYIIFIKAHELKQKIQSLEADLEKLQENSCNAKFSVDFLNV